MKQTLRSTEVIKLFSEKVEIPPGLEDLVVGYAQNIKGDLFSLKESIENKDTDNIEKIIHKLKGTAKSYGFNVVDAVLVMMKNLEQEGEHGEMSILCGELIKYVEDFLCDYET